MNNASRLFAGLAALALVLAGTAIAPSKAHAATDTGETLLAVGIFATAVVLTFVLVDEEGDSDQAPPQSP